MQSHPHDKIVAQFGLSPAEWAVLFTVGYDVKLQRDEFIPHVIWEDLDRLSEAEVSQALDDCMLKGWVYINVNGIPEFTDDGYDLYLAARRGVREYQQRNQRLMDDNQATS